MQMSTHSVTIYSVYIPVLW